MKEMSFEEWADVYYPDYEMDDNDDCDCPKCYGFAEGCVWCSELGSLYAYKIREEYERLIANVIDPMKTEAYKSMERLGQKTLWKE